MTTDDESIEQAGEEYMDRVFDSTVSMCYYYMLCAFKDGVSAGIKAERERQGQSRSESAFRDWETQLANIDAGQFMKL